MKLESLGQVLGVGRSTIGRQLAGSRPLAVDTWVQLLAAMGYGVTIHPAAYQVAGWEVRVGPLPPPGGVDLVHASSDATYSSISDAGMVALRDQYHRAETWRVTSLAGGRHKVEVPPGICSSAKCWCEELGRFDTFDATPWSTSAAPSPRDGSR